MVMDFPVWTICMFFLSMIASWFSIARKCEELPLQRDVWPTSTNPQLMASRSNRPQQPHSLQRFLVLNSPARFLKKEKKRKENLSSTLWKHVRVIKISFRGKIKYQNLHPLLLKFRITRRRRVGRRFLRKRWSLLITVRLRLLGWLVAVTLRSRQSSPWWPQAEPKDRN